MKRATAKLVAVVVPWKVKFHREVGKDVVDYGLSNPSFVPTIGELVAELERDPKQYAKKHGKLKTARAADLRFGDVKFRAVFVLNEAARTVLVLSFDKHDAAYSKAIRRAS